MINYFKRRRRSRLLKSPLPETWLSVIERNVPYYRYLTATERDELGGLVQAFIAEKYFEGCNGLMMTDDIRVTIAAQACLLLLGRDHDLYPELRTILVYPYAYFAPTVQRDGWVVNERRELRSGESWEQGTVVLSWDDVMEGAGDAHDGWNVVFHEFAHQLDSEADGPDGTPELPDRAMYETWISVMKREYEDFLQSIRLGLPILLDEYGATSPAEFFAVSTEYFFERPIELQAVHPDLYEQLALYYRRDPAEAVAEFWQTAAGGHDIEPV